MEMVKIGEIAEIHHGYAFPSSGFVDVETPYYLLTPGNFLPNGGFQEGKPRFFDGPIRSDFVLEPGEILISMTDLSRNIDTLGSPMIVPENDRWKYLHNQRLGKLVVNSESVDPTWLYHRLRMADYRHYIAATSTGTTVHHTSPKTIAEFEFRLPPMTTQNVIGRLFRVLDDKITANKEVMRLTDKTIQSIWRQLTCEASSFVEFGDVVQLNPRTAAPKGSRLTTIEMKNLPESGFSVDTWEYREAKGGSRYRNGDTLVARITPCFENGKCGYVDFLGPDEVGAGSTEFIVLRPQPGVPSAAPYAIARSSRFRTFAEQTMTGTSGRQRVQARDLEAYEIAWPNSDLLSDFGSMTSPLLDLAGNLRDENLALTKTRDELLPLLMNGKIAVKEAEQEAAAAGADIAGEESED